MKVEKRTPRKPEVIGIAKRLGITPDDAFSKCFRVWEWFDDHTVDGNASFVTPDVLDSIIGCVGLAEAMESVGWLNTTDAGISLPNFDRHNGETAKQRALTKNRQAARRGCGNGKVTNESLPEREGEGEREGDPSKDLRASGNRGARTPPPQSNHSPRDFLREEEPFDTSMVDWDHVAAMAESVGKRVSPQTEADRRAWLRYSVLADTSFGEEWIIDAAEAVARSGETRTKRTAHFVGVLQSKARDQHGVEPENLNAMAKRIEIPSDVWKSPILKVVENEGNTRSR